MAEKWDEMRAAYLEAEAQVRAADAIAGDMAKMLKGRLHQVSGYVLADLKKELRDFNIQTKRWMR